jgi:dienelactone hydrolase
MRPEPLDALAARLEPHLHLRLPTGPGPFPVVVQMHGCGGLQAAQFAYAEAAAARGVAAVIVDSLAPRGIGKVEARLTVCTGTRLRGAERARDLSAVLLWLERQPWADKGRAAAAGWSHGGWSVMEALAAEPADPRVAALKLVALFYPYAGPPARTAARGWGENRPRVFACLAGRDAVVGVRGPRRALERLRADGLSVSILDLPLASHAFDETEPSPDPRTRYRPDFAQEARTAYLEALTKALLGSA